MDFAALGQNLSHYESGLHGTGEVSLCGERYTAKTLPATCSGM